MSLSHATGRHLLGVHFTGSPKTNFCTALTEQNTTKTNGIYPLLAINVCSRESIIVPSASRVVNFLISLCVIRDVRFIKHSTRREIFKLFLLDSLVKMHSVSAFLRLKFYSISSVLLHEKYSLRFPTKTEDVKYQAFAAI
jgi:hypothetical protein